MECEKIKEIIKQHGFEIRNVLEDNEKCIIDFKHPKIVVKPPVAYFLSSVAFNKKTGSLNTTIRSKVSDVKELYLDYCCEQEKTWPLGLLKPPVITCEQVCRPHVHMEEKILSVEATFNDNQLNKFDRLIEELK